MCDCIKNIEKDLPEKTGEISGKKIISASMQNVVFPMSNLKITGKITTQPIELKLDGRKTPFKSSLSHTFCPWCGEKYERDRDEDQDVQSEKVKA